MLDRLHDTLAHPDAGLREAELPWLIGRIGELLGWEASRWWAATDASRPAD